MAFFLKGKISRFVFLVITCFLLFACGDEPTPTSSLPPTQTSPIKTVTANSTIGQSVVSAAISTLPTTPIPQNDAQTQARAALTKFASANGYRFKVQQKATLSSSSASSILTAEGEGQKSVPNLSQKLSLTINTGQAQQLDGFILNGVGWQKLSSLAVWRKVELNPRWETQLSPTILDKASAIQGGTDPSGTTKVTFSLPVELFFTEPASFGPDWLGILPATGVKNGLTGTNATGTAQITLWIDSNGQLIQRQTLIQYGGPDNRLNFEVNYQYQDFNAAPPPLVIPTDFPRQP